MSSQPPTDEEFLAAVKTLWSTTNPPPGVKNLVSSLKASHPDWEPYINGKTVRVAVKKCEDETGISNKTAGEGVSPTKEGQKLDAEGFLRAQAESLRDWMATHPWPRALPRKDMLISPNFVRSSLLPHVMLPAVAAAPPIDADPLKRKMHLAFHVFYLEWDCFMGPDPAVPLPPATPLVPNQEALAFLMLFPYGTGHYLGPEQQRGLTFEQYALHRLNLADERFRHSAEWLTWVLTRTADPELAKAVNCVLVTLHKQKARHLGGGEVETLSLDVPFKRIGGSGGSKKSER